MKKGKIMAVGLIGLLMAVGLVMAGCNLNCDNNGECKIKQDANGRYDTSNWCDDINCAAYKYLTSCDC